MKFFIKFSIYVLLVASVILTIVPAHMFPAFLDVRYMGLAALVQVGLIYFLPRFLAVPTDQPNAEIKNKAVENFQFLMALTFFINAVGDAGFYQLYKIGFEFDKFLHFTIPTIATFIFTIFFYYRFEFKRVTALPVTTLIVAVLAIGWEVFEYTMDYYFHTHIHGVNGINLSFDTQIDLLLDATGIIIGSILAFFQLKPMPKLRPRLLLPLRNFSTSKSFQV